MPAQDVRAALARPDFYPGRPDTVEIHETHISWVFLAGDRAYKLKKPLVLPFLDYGTPQRRREMCHEEVRLNRRLARHLYLGVLAVAVGAAGLELVAEDDPRAVDYLVEMRRYDESETVAAKLERGELSLREAAAVGRALARFHARAAPVVAGGGVPLSVEREIMENLRELLAIVEQRAEVGSLISLERFVHAFVVAHAQLLNARVQHGLVREGHGDLRAEHVVFGPKLEIVDCVEFSSELRMLDVADDLAFLVMDLEARGGKPFADAIVRAYRQAGGDPGEDWLIAFTRPTGRSSERRSHAVCLQRPASSSEQGHESAAARDYILLAERFAWRARLPLVIVVCGVPGAGKSHLAQTLGEVSGLPRISSDETRKRLAGIEPHERAGAAVYGEDFNRLTYTELGRRAAGDGGVRWRARRCDISPSRRPGSVRRGVRECGADAVRRVPRAPASAHRAS